MSLKDDNRALALAIRRGWGKRFLSGHLTPKEIKELNEDIQEDDAS